MEKNNQIPFRAHLRIDGIVYDIPMFINELNICVEKKASPDWDRMLMALKSLNAGTWTFDISNNSLIVCDRCKELITSEDGKEINIKSFYDRIPSEHKHKLLETFLRALKTDSPFDLEVPIAANDSRPKWLRIAGTASCHHKTSAPKLHGLVEDISEKKYTELLTHDLHAMVSHDLRSPLSVIKLYIQSCNRIAANMKNGTITGFLEKAESQVQKMDNMIHSYLESPEIRTGGTGVSPETFEIKNLLKEVIHNLRLLHPWQNFILKPGPDIMVYADRNKIAQVIQNLLSNAVKYSSTTDIITVHFKKVENNLQVTVKDQGIGIKPSDQKKIFDRFYRSKSNKKTAVDGYGIGLYFSKEIIRQHGGEIWLKSDDKKGSEFYFTLPLSCRKIIKT